MEIARFAHRRHLLVLLLLVSMLVLSACPSAAPAPAPAQPAAPAAPAPAEPAAPAPAEPAPAPAEPAPAEPVAPAAPQVLTIASGTDIENMNIHVVTASPSFTVLEHIYETLFYMNTDGELEPLLAEEMVANDDGSFTIKLRQDVTFSDGAPFTAEAVKANLDWVLDTANAATFRFLIDRIEEVVVVDDYTVDIKLTSEFAPLAAHLSHGALAMVHPDLLAQGSEAMAANAIGTGPFLLDSWQRDEAVTLKKNPNYWGGAPTLDTVVFKVVKEDGARLVEIEAGTADVAKNVPPAEAARLDADPNISIVTTPGLRTIYIFFNVTEEPFTDARVRQAVNYAVDVEGIVSALFDGAARVSDAPFAPPIFGYSAQTPYARDVDKAKELLEAAGVEPGTKVVLYHPTGRYIQDALVADAVRSQLRDVGLEAELTTLEWPQYVPYVRREKPENDVQFAMLGWSTPTMDADYALFALFHSSQIPPGFNGAFYANPEVDALLEEARTNPDQDARQQAYADAIAIIWEEAPWLFLYSEVQLTAIRDNVQGFVVHPNERLIATGATKQ